VIHDVRLALITIRRAPAFAVTALVTLALGIGATTAVFSVIKGVLLRPLPYPGQDRLVRLWEEHPGGVSPAGNRWLSRSTYAVWRDRMRTLDAIGGYALYERRLTVGREPIKVFSASVSPVVLSTLATAPALGRFLNDDDDREGAPRVVVVSDELWRERYASSPSVVGQSLVIDGEAHTIVGVAPRAFAFPDPRVRVWLPYIIPRTATQATGTVVFTALGRLKAGVTPAQAEAEGTAAAQSAPPHRLTELFFGKGGPAVVHARPLVDDITAAARPALSILAVSVTLVLLMACANVANLMLSRGVARQRELAIRTAIGGSRARIVRQLFTESAVFAAIGGTLGLMLAWWLVGVLPAVAPARLPRIDAVTLDASVLTFFALVTFVVTMAVGGVSAVRSARVDVYDAFRGADGSSSSGFRSVQARRLRDGLLIVEAAFAVILIVAASLLARSFVRLMHVDNGYTAADVLIATAELPTGTTDARIDHLIESALPRVRNLPGVSSVGAGGMIPLMLRTLVAPFVVPDAIAGGKPTNGRAYVYLITPGYAEALGLRLRQGRFFTDLDRRSDTLATMVNDEFMRQHLNVPAVVGLRIPNLVGPNQGQTVTAEIVGVVGNVLKNGNDQPPLPELYFIHGSHGQRIGDQVQLVIRTTASPAAVAPDVRAIVRQIEPDALVDHVEPLTTTVATSLDAPRFSSGVMVGFASVAMLLAAIGLYGALSYSLSQQVRELGIRAALGARQIDLVRLVLREGLTTTFGGVALGLIGASLVTRLMQDLLFGVTPLDPIAFALAPAILVIASLAACLGPALRAAAIDPATTLRAQ
jgi:putative ABC transport system permease protein